MACYAQTAQANPTDQANPSNTNNPINTKDLNTVELDDGSIIYGNIVSQRGDLEVAISLVSGTILRYPVERVVNINYRRQPIEQIEIAISDVVLLTNESVFKGIITQDDDQGVKIKTRSSSVFAFERDQVKRIVSFDQGQGLDQEDIKFFSLAERENIFARDKKELWLTILLDLLPGGGYAYLWSTGENYFNFVGDTFYQDVLIASFSIPLDAFNLYLSLDAFAGGPISSLEEPTRNLIYTIAFPLYLIAKAVELWHVIVRTIDYNDYLRKDVLQLRDRVDDRKTSWVDFLPNLLPNLLPRVTFSSYNERMGLPKSLLGESSGGSNGGSKSGSSNELSDLKLVFTPLTLRL